MERNTYAFRILNRPLKISVFSIVNYKKKKKNKREIEKGRETGKKGKTEQSFYILNLLDLLTDAATD